MNPKISQADTEVYAKIVAKYNSYKRNVANEIIDRHDAREFTEFADSYGVHFDVSNGQTLPQYIVVFEALGYGGEW
jgi:hypothetical protein